MRAHAENVFVQRRFGRSTLRNGSRLDSSGFGNCLGVWDFVDLRKRSDVEAFGVSRLAIGLRERA